MSVRELDVSRSKVSDKVILSDYFQENYATLKTEKLTDELAQTYLNSNSGSAAERLQCAQEIQYNADVYNLKIKTAVIIILLIIAALVLAYCLGGADAVLWTSMAITGARLTVRYTPFFSNLEYATLRDKLSKISELIAHAKWAYAKKNRKTVTFKPKLLN